MQILLNKITIQILIFLINFENINKRSDIQQENSFKYLFIYNIRSKNLKTE